MAEPSGFDYVQRKNGDIVIYHRGRTAVTLRGRAADQFRQRVAPGDPQQFMARATGNYKRGQRAMSEVVAGITTSVDGYYVGPEDGPGQGLGLGGERLHYWVFGGPWSYDSPPDGEPGGEDGEWLAEAMATVGAVVGGRGTYEAAEHWGGSNPWGLPFFIVTHRIEEQPDPSAGFVFVDGVEAAVDQERAAAGGKDVHLMGAETSSGRRLAPVSWTGSR